MFTEIQSLAYTRCQKLTTFFSEQAAIYTLYPPFASEVQSFLANFSQFQAFAPQKAFLGNGITSAKTALKKSIAQTGGAICKTATAYALKYANAGLAAQISQTQNSIFKLKDPSILPFALNLSKNLQPLFADPNFLPYQITTQMLSNLITNATIYNNSIGQAPLAKSVSTVANQNINATIKLLNKNIRQFRLLLHNFATINSAFATECRLLCAWQNPVPHHSGFRGLITDAATGLPLPNARIAIEGTKKSAIAGLSGNYELIKMHPGNYQITFSAPNYTTKTIVFHITRGNIATLDIQL
jgi:hypothetical protein